MWKYFKEFILDGKFIPQGWEPPSMEKINMETSNLRVKIRRKSKLWTRFRFSLLETRNSSIHRDYKKLHNDIRKETHHLTREEQCTVANQCKANPKNFWKYVNSKSRLQSKIGNLNTIDDEGCSVVLYNDKGKANALANFFASIFTCEPDTNFEELTP